MTSSRARVRCQHLWVIILLSIYVLGQPAHGYTDLVPAREGRGYTEERDQGGHPKVRVQGPDVSPFLAILL